jgi:uncharacterized protein (DUF934 family)
MSRLIEGSIIDGGRIVDDTWITVETGEGLHAAPEQAPVLVAHAVWASDRDALIARGTPIGVRLAASDDPASIADDLDRFALVAVDFPKFTDGRGYSIARLLRQRYGYRGPLRAVGDVLRDQIFYMLRCGFDSFALKHDAQIDDALSAYHDFTEAYQTSVEREAPLFARRDQATA